MKWCNADQTSWDHVYNDLMLLSTSEKVVSPIPFQLQELVYFAETCFYVRFTKLIGVGLLASPPE